MNSKRVSTLAAIAAIGALTLASCAANEGGPSTPSGLTGSLAGSGASAQEKAQAAWTAGFQGANPEVTIDYDAGGSGAGRTAFLEGGVDFAGSDRAFKLDEIATGLAAGNTKAAEGSEIIELPLYISPIAVGFNLEGVTELNLDAATIAGIFSLKITNWNDPAIAAHNPGVTLPDLAITPIYRSTNSGTTENFTDYLAAVAPEVWTFEKSGDWPAELAVAPAEGVAETGDVAGALGQPGTIGYLDASRAPGSTVALKVGDAYVSYSPEAAAAVADASPFETGRSEGDLAIALDRTTTAAGAYPLVLISYVIVHSDYADDAKAELVKAYLSYIASTEGQAAAAAAPADGGAGSAPISESLRAKILPVIDSIK